MARGIRSLKVARTAVGGLLATAMGATVFTVAPPPAGAVAGSVVINELHYHAPTDVHDFIELHNPGDTAVDIGGACFTSGITGCFAGGTTLAPGAYLIAAESPADYATAFPSGPAATLDHGGSLSNGGETVTLSLGVDVLDTVTYDDSSPWPVSPDGDGPSLELTDPLADNDDATSWAASDPAPTPGAQNTRYGQGPAPVITDVEVGTTAANAPTTVTAHVTGASTIELEVVVGFGDPQVIAMADDGAHGDGAAGDKTYGATVPAQPANTLVRYEVRADAAGVVATVPDAGDSRPRLGFIVAPTTPPTALPLLQWFIAPDDLETLYDNIETNDYVPAVIAYGDQVWDGAEVRGQGNLRSTPKKSFKVKMPNDHPLVAPGLVTEPVDELVLDNDRVDAMGTTAIVGLDTYAEGNPFVPQHAKVRVHRNGTNFGLFTLLEEWEDGFFDRVGLDQPGAAVYEPEDIAGVFIDEGSPEALEPRFEKLAGQGDSYADLYELVQAIDGPPTPARSAQLRDLLDMPALVEFLAVGNVLQHWDQTIHNYLVIRDPETGRWRFGPSDMDNTMGLPLSQTTTPKPRFPHILPYGPDSLVSALRTDPLFTEMYFRRVRTLADELLAGGGLEERADALAASVATDVEQDRVLYGDQQFTAAQGRAALGEYVDFKTQHLLSTRRRTDEIPAAPTAGRPVVVSELAYAASGGAGRDFVELHNPSNESIDLSGWTIEGAGEATLPAGTVLPARGFLVVPGDQEATTGDRPSGTLVAGELADGLADGGGTVVVRDAGGAVRGQAPYGTSGSWPTAPAAGTATLELNDPSTAGTGPSSWRASSTATGSPGRSGNAPDPAPAGRLSVEASADQVEAKPGDGRVFVSVVVTNTGTAPRPGVTLTGSGATCPARVGTLAPGASATLRCRTTGHPTPDRTYTFTAKSGSVQARSGPVYVRTLDHFTQYYERHVPGAPTAAEATVRSNGRVSLRWTQPKTTSLPFRWTVITECAPGRAVPTGGTLLAPGSSAQLDHLPLDEPVQLAVSVRSRAATGPRTAQTPVLTPRDSAVFPFASTGALVRRFFAAVEGRQPTTAEVSEWTSAIAGGTSPSRIVTDGLAERRWSNDVAPIARLYAAYFGRLPDQDGLTFWVGRRRAGVGLDTVSTSFSRTAEFEQQYGSLSNGAFVSQLYRNVFGREADATGRAYWVDRLANGTSRGQVVTAFSESAEGRKLLAPMTQTSLVWTALTGSTPSLAVARPAVDWLAGGGSLLTVVEGLRTSDRYQDHVS